MKKLPLIILCLFVLINSCTQSNKITNEDNLIISKIIDDFSYPLPPPPPIGGNDTIIPNKTIDSLSKIKMITALYPVMESTIEESGLMDTPLEFKRLVKVSKERKYIHSVEGIKSQKGHSVLLADTLELKKAYDFTEFDLLFWFSKIWYNSEKTKAIFEVGISRSRLNGSAVILCMEKTENGWSIVKTIATTEW